jgi:hypothetical protein
VSKNLSGLKKDEMRLVPPSPPRPPAPVWGEEFIGLAASGGGEWEDEEGELGRERGGSQG